MIDTGHLPLGALTAAVVVLVSIWVWRRSSASSASSTAAAAEKLAAIAATHKRLAELPPPAGYITQLAAALPPGRVVLPKDHPEAFVAAMDAHFSMQNRGVLFEPSCVVQPRSVDELGVAVRHIAKEHTLRSTAPQPANDSSNRGRGLFAVRCTGANPAQGVAGVKDGILLDLSRLNTIALSADKTILTVGGGCSWESIYEYLDPLQLAVVGGRSSPVGVGGSTLGGGMSFYSGHHGLMCSNVAAYTVVLADGSITTASAAENPDLWRALKGGVNNFGVVAEFRLRVYPGGPVWQRVTITPSFLTGSVVRAYYEHGIQAARADKFDPNVSTPIMSFAYMPDLGMAFWCTQLFYTVRPPSSVSSDSALPGQQDDNSDSGPRKIGDKTWPAYWKASPLGRLWGIPMRRSTATTHAQAVRHVGDMSALEMRNSYVVTGFRLDLPTMHAAVDVFHRAKARLSALTPGGTAFCMVFQTLNPRWMNKGDPNVLGLEGEEEPLVVLEFCCNWADARHDKLVEEVFREAIAEVEKASAELGSAHRYRFTNYASEWQRPLEGYGEENLQFMREVSRRYDPKGLFQTGCLGGFKLGREDL